jgi:hypothetical protein
MADWNTKEVGYGRSQEDQERMQWRAVHTEYFTDSKGAPVATRINKAEIAGQTRYGIELRFSDKFVAFSSIDLDKMIASLTALRDMMDSMALPYQRAEPGIASETQNLIMELVKKAIDEKLKNKKTEVVLKDV